jgi:polar amino acid transport system substrate-binding protein
MMYLHSKVIRLVLASLLVFSTWSVGAFAQTPPAGAPRAAPRAQPPAQPPPQPAQPVQPAQPQPAQPSQELSVGTRVLAPFIIQDNGQYSGFSADLWRAIAAELGLKTRFTAYGRLPEMLDGVKTGKDALAISAISITAQREKTFEFSQPMFRSGLSIMVPSASGGLNMMGMVFSIEMLKVVGIFLLVLLIPAHLIWFLARGRDEGLPISQSYFAGIIDAIFWCAESMGGAAQAHPQRAIARIVAVIWIYAGLVFIAYFTAYATTTLTMQSLRGDINGPKDLAGKQVAVVQGSTSAQYAGGLKARLSNFPDFQAAAAAMLEGKAQAVVYDAPVILYYVKNEPRAQMAGQPFREENYGILFPIGSPLRRPVNEALLTLFENGTYESLYKKWFGEGESIR